MNVLVVEDDAISADMLEHALGRFGYDVTCARDGREAMQRLQTGDYRLVISDWEMPHVSGIELCRYIREYFGGQYVYVILLTSRSGRQNVVEGLTAGADEFLSKPFDPQELYVRLRIAERILALESREMTIFSLAKLADSRDPETGAHLERMREYCRILAEHLSENSPYAEQMHGDYVHLIYLTSPLHDIGKVGIPDRILLKPGKLTEDEYAIMKRHAEIGAETLTTLVDAYPDAPYLRMARDIASTHHERYDGKGYPRGLRGKEIPLCGRITAVADVYDALTSQRVYKPAFTHEHARQIICEASGTQFDPEVVEAFVATEDRFLEIRSRYAEPSSQTLDEPSARQADASAATAR